MMGHLSVFPFRNRWHTAATPKLFSYGNPLDTELVISYIATLYY